MEAANQAAFNEENLCLQVIGQYVLHQDRYIMELETQNCRYRDMLFRVDKAFLVEEQEKN